MAINGFAFREVIQKISLLPRKKQSMIPLHQEPLLKKFISLKFNIFDRFLKIHKINCTVSNLISDVTLKIVAKNHPLLRISVSQ